MQRLLLVLIFGLFSGGVIGAYAMNSLYGQNRLQEPRPAELVQFGNESAARCPPCPQCQVCAPQNDCDVPPPVIGPTDGDNFTLDESEVAKDTAPQNGLPVRVLGEVVKELSTQLQVCRSSSVSEGIIVDLTVTATGGFARVSDAKLVNEVENSGLVECFMRNYSRPQLPWSGQDGAMRLRQVFNLGE